MSAPIRNAPPHHDFTNSAVAAALGLVTGWLIGDRRRRSATEQPRSVAPGEPDDPAWHAALNRDRSSISVN